MNTEPLFLDSGENVRARNKATVSSSLSLFLHCAFVCCRMQKRRTCYFILVVNGFQFYNNNIIVFLESEILIFLMYLVFYFERMYLFNSYGKFYSKLACIKFLFATVEQNFKMFPKVLLIFKFIFMF